MTLTPNEDFEEARIIAFTFERPILSAMYLDNQ